MQVFGRSAIGGREGRLEEASGGGIGRRHLEEASWSIGEGIVKESGSSLGALWDLSGHSLGALEAGVALG